MRWIVALVILWSLPLHAQLRVTSMDRIATADQQAWGALKFSPDGTRLFLTPQDYRGIWELTISTGSLREITTDPGSGYGFALSDDGATLGYRRTTYDQKSRARLQELIAIDLRTGSSSVAGGGRNAGTPAFAGNTLIARVDGRDLQKTPPAPGATAILGIEELKIAVLSGGTSRLLEPLGRGRYVWPALAPDKSRLAAYELARGVFVCALDGTRTIELGPYRAPAWTRDGLRLICMDDRDDGRRYLGSRLVAVMIDGSGATELPGTGAIGAMYPACSPVEDLIACVSMSGDVYLVRYATEAR
jgi:hypothetical protein